jgi:hypothetical protein
MNDSNTELSSEVLNTRCRGTADASTAALEWFNDDANSDKLGQERMALERDFRRGMTQARKLEAAVERPMCVGVFGASQAGKSYLVSVLARQGDNPLMALFEGEEDGVDFISQINPSGGKESTGLVTRFTINPHPHPPGFPVCLRLLSQSDIVKILGNTFFMDGDLKRETPPTAEEIGELVAAASSVASAAPTDTLTEEDIWDIQEYFEQQFTGTPYLQALSGFWDEACALAPKLSIRDRAKLFAVLWGRHEKFTNLYITLIEALSQLAFAGEAFCTLDALIPKQDSIIDVATLAGLGDEGTTDTLKIRPQQGNEITLPRAVVTALVAELRIVVKDKPWPFFDHTDLLDFPGARSRQKLRLEDFLEEEEEALKETFLRGRVAYLFDRYVAEQELTSMLLCVKGSNQEVAELPDMIDGWITTTHGPEPRDREGRPTVLFFVLTMFDEHFVEKAGEEGGDPGERFKSRMYASMLGYYAKAHKWPKEWTPGKPFNNCFWLRNPNYPAESIIEYEGRQEVAFLPNKIDRIAELKSGCLDVPEVCDHFVDPETAWEEALKLNDGGVSFLANKLGPVCNPSLKLDQIAVRLRTLRQGMRDKLDRFYISDDVEKRLVERRLVADKVIDGLYGAADEGRFGVLLRMLQVNPGDLTDVLYQVHMRAPDAEEKSVVITRAPRPSAARIRPGANRPRPGQAPAVEQADTAETIETAGSDDEPETDAPKSITLEELYATAALKYWMKTAHGLADNTRIARSLSISNESLTELVGELTAGVRRLKLADEIAVQIREILYIERGEQSAVKAALIASRMINRFVDHLGFDLVPEDQRPVVEGEGVERPVFASRAVAFDLSAIGGEPVAYREDYLLDWVFAFYKLVEDNASSDGGEQYDREQNARLGNIMGLLEQPV